MQVLLCLCSTASGAPGGGPGVLAAGVSFFVKVCLQSAVCQICAAASHFIMSQGPGVWLLLARRSATLLQ